jgi:hypothetical protein
MSDSKKRKNTVPSYRLHKASGRAVVTLQSPGQRRGRDVFLGRFGTDESHQRYAQVIAEWNSTGHLRPAPTSDITIVELVDRYWAHVCSYYVKDGNAQSAAIEQRDQCAVAHRRGPIPTTCVHQRSHFNISQHFWGNRLRLCPLAYLISTVRRHCL